MNNNKTTRRDFLKTGAGLAAAGIATPYFFSAAAANAEEAKSDKLTVAAIGVGGRGSDIGRQAAELGRHGRLRRRPLGPRQQVRQGTARSLAASARSIRTTARCSTARTCRP